MTTGQPSAEPAIGIAAHVESLVRDGVTGLKGAFGRAWVEDMRADMMTAFWAEMQRPGGAVVRGPRRRYVEVHPQDFRGFADSVTHPWVVAMAQAVAIDRTDGSTARAWIRVRPCFLAVELPPLQSFGPSDRSSRPQYQRLVQTANAGMDIALKASAPACDVIHLRQSLPAGAPNSQIRQR